MHRSLFLAVTAGCFALSFACEPLPEARSVLGNYDLTYDDVLRVYLNDQLIAEVAPGDDPTLEFDGQTFELTAVCGDDGTQCPSETFWHRMAVDQPLGTGNKLLNFVNLDPERGQVGQRLAGLMQGDGSFAMLAGVGLDGNEACAVLGVAKVIGAFAPGNAPDIDQATIVYEWGAGCQIAGTTLTGSLRLETDVHGVRTGDLDLAGAPDEPLDEAGEPLEE